MTASLAYQPRPGVMQEEVHSSLLCRKNVPLFIFNPTAPFTECRPAIFILNHHT
jgi:hypothetical protein